MTLGPTKSTSAIVAEFDEIAAALAACPARDALSAAERSLLRHVPSGARTAIDVGCGDGVTCRALARRGLAVTGVDASPAMIALARARTLPPLRVAYRVADLTRDGLPPHAFDVVTCVNVVHHFALDDVLPRLADAVAPGGVLLVQDVVRRPQLRHALVNAVGALRAVARGVRGRSRGDAAVRALYARHGAGEAYLMPAEADAAYARLLPGARVAHHVDWRYSAIWVRPAAPTALRP